MTMSYTTLTAAKSAAGSIKRWVNYNDLDVDEILEDAQSFIYQTLRVREMRSEFTNLSMSVGDSSKALPADFLDPISLIDITNNLVLMPDGYVLEQEMEAGRVYESGVLVSGIPTRVAIYSEALQFDVKYDTAATLRLVGYKRPANLASDNLTNFLTTRYPHLLRAACKLYATDFQNNGVRYERALSEVAALIAKTNEENDSVYRGI